MALIGERSALIPIGLSSQVAYQLHENRDCLSNVVGEKLVYSSSFFNWIYISALAVPGLIERLVAGPLAPSSIHVPTAYHRAVMIEDHKAWLWHEKPSHLVTPEMVEVICSKYEHLRCNFLTLASKPKRYFVLCNAQNDVKVEYPYIEGEMILEFNDSVLREIRLTLDRVFPDGENTLLALAPINQCSNSMREIVFPLPPDTTSWEGSAAAWREVLELVVYP